MSISSEVTSIEENLQADYEGLENLGADLTGINKNIYNIRTILDTIYNDLPKVTGEGTEVTLSPTRKGRLALIPKGNSVQAILPSEYQQVEYIASSGTQYIDTGVTGNQDYSIKLDFQFTSINSTRGVYGSISSNNDNRFETYLTPASRYEYGYGNVYYIDSTNIPDTNRHTLEHTKNVVKIDGNVACTFTERSFNWSGNAYLFNMNRPTMLTGASYKLYSSQLWNDNNILIRNFIPCYRISDNVIGLYDIVGNQFYTNAGTGTFTKGENAPTPNAEIPIKSVTGNNNVVVHTLNLFNKNASDITTGKFLNESNSTTNNSFYNITGYIEVKPNTTYVVSAEYAQDTGISPSYHFYDINKNYISGTKHNDTTMPYTITTPANCYYIRDTLSTRNIDSYMLEKGSTATTYVPYGNQTKPLNLGTIELNKIGTYQDYIYKNNGNWYKKEIITQRTFTGLENWNADGNNRFSLSLPNMENKVYAIKSNYFIQTIDWANHSATNNSIIKYKNEAWSNGRISINASQFENNINTFKTFLQNNSVYSYEEAITPQDIQITDTSLIEQLEDIDKMQGYNGTTIITSTYDSNNAQMYISASALKGEE